VEGVLIHLCLQVGKNKSASQSCKADIASDLPHRRHWMDKLTCSGTTSALLRLLPSLCAPVATRLPNELPCARPHIMGVMGLATRCFPKLMGRRDMQWLEKKSERFSGAFAKQSFPKYGRGEARLDPYAHAIRGRWIQGHVIEGDCLVGIILQALQIPLYFPIQEMA